MQLGGIDNDQSRDLQPLFQPASIAVIGASSDPAKISGMPIAHLKAFGYSGKIFPVNPKSPEIQGLRAWPDLVAIGQPIDLAICAVPATLVGSAVDQAAAAGVRSMVVFSSGFAEVGEEGRRAQEELINRARNAGIRVLGPNTNGLINVRAGVTATFTPALRSGLPRPGGIALVSQSGAFGVFALVRARERGLGISHCVGTGNEGDVALADCIDHLVSDPDVKVILGYIEGIRDGARFVDALGKAQRAGKPVAICKAGRSQVGAKAAQSHTAALAGRDEIYDSIFRQFGVIRATSLEELFDIGYAFDVSPPIRGNRLGIVSISGGAGVLLADAADRYSLEVPAVPVAEQTKLLERVPFASARNPVDITGQSLNDMGLLDDTLDWMARLDFNAIVSFQAITGVSPAHRTLVTDTWTRFRAKFPDLPAAVVTVFDEELRSHLEARNVLAFEELERATKAIGTMASFEATKPRSDALTLQEVPVPGPIPSDEVEALSWLKNVGMPVVDCRRAYSAEEAVESAKSLGFPVVLKIISPDIAHKSDVGGVALNLANAAAVRRAYKQVRSAVARAAPKARQNGVLVAPMLSGAVEAIVGVTKDPVFGPVVMFGLGGVLVEVLNDVSFRRAPFDVAEAKRMIREIRSYRVLDGVRGRPAVDVEALANLLSTLSVFATRYEDRYSSIDMNPVLLFKEGDGVCAVDALVCADRAADAQH